MAKHVEEAHVLRTAFFHRVLGTYGTQLLMAVLSVASGVVVARTLGPEGRGAYAVASVIAVIGVQLGSLGLQGANSYLVARDRSLLAMLLANSLVSSVVIGGSAAGVCWLLLHMLRASAPIAGPLMLLSLLGIPLGLAYLFAVNLLMGLQEVRRYNTIELLNKTLAVVLVVAAIGLGGRTPQLLFLGVLAAQALGLFLAFRMLRKLCAGAVLPSWRLFRENLGIGWRVYLTCLFGFLVIRIDLLMVRSMLGAAAAGYYSIAGNLGDYVLMLPAAVSAVLFPKLSAMRVEKEKLLLTAKATLATCLVLIFVLAALTLTAKPLIALLFGRAFSPASTSVLFLAPGILFLGLEVVLVQYLNSCAFPASVVWLWIGSTVLNVVLNFWAIPVYGINGAAAVSSFSYFLALAGVAWITRKKWFDLKTYRGNDTASHGRDHAIEPTFAMPAIRGEQR